MKLQKILLTLICVMCPLISQAQDNHSEDRQQLLGILADTENALNAKNIGAVEPLMDKDIVITFQDGSVVRGGKEVRQYFDKMLGSANPVLSGYATKAEVSAPANFYGDIAIADGKTHDQFTFVGGKVLNIETLWTAVMRKDGNTWKVIRMHFSSSIFDNPLVKMAEKNAVYMALAAGVIGLLLGFFVGRKGRAKA